MNNDPAPTSAARGADPSSLRAILRPYWRYLVPITLLGVLGSLLEGIGIGTLIPLIGMMMGPVGGGAGSGFYGKLLGLAGGISPLYRTAILGGGIAVLIVAKSLIQVANNLVILHVERDLSGRLATLLSKRLLEVPYSFFLKNGAVRPLHVLSNDVWIVSDMRGMLSAIPAAIGLVVFAGILAWLDWRLFLCVVLFAMVAVGILKWIERGQRRFGIALTQADLKLEQRIWTVVHASRVVRLFGQQTREQARFAGVTAEVTSSAYAAHRLTACVAPLLDIVLVASIAAILIAAQRLGVALPLATTFLVLLSRAQPMASTISEARMNFAIKSGSMREIEWLLSQPTDPGGDVVAGAVPDLTAPIRFDRVSFGYHENSPIIRDATFEIPAGQVTALIGPSGAGKTSLVNILCRLLEPDAGAIFAGAVPAADIPADAWRARIAVAGQDLQLIAGTIAENIAYGTPGADRAAIEAAAHATGAAGFIAALPDGYETLIGEERHALSGGQRQRIALARALVMKPQLLILDEATNAIDAVSEQEIADLLQTREHFGTALVISHRRSTRAACQHGIVIRDGRIVETGPLMDLAYFRAMAGRPGSELE
jgi:subfamily B ATP-binding cassette protein MsbA